MTATMQTPTIMLINLGSPSSLDVSDIRKYLKQMLSDDEIIDLPKPLQQFIIRAFVLPFRPKKSRSAYEKIWTSEGSPLLINTQKISRELKKKTSWNVEVAMRYQEPSIRKTIQKISKDDCKELIVIPLYPHNAMATVGSTKKEVERIAMEVNEHLRINFLKPFFNHSDYIDCLVKSITPHITDKLDMLLFSYHGLPERQIRKSDPGGDYCLTEVDCCMGNCSITEKCYRANTQNTARLTAEKLGLEKDKWTVSYQSRVSAIGPKWLSPYTSDELKRYPDFGIKNVVVVCPSFVCDCLETLFEIDIEGRDIFTESGGTSFTFVPCLNDNSDFINFLQSEVSGLLT